MTITETFCLRNLKYTQLERQTLVNFTVRGNRTVQMEKGKEEKRGFLQLAEVANYFYVEERVQSVARSHAHLR
jgi:hypothetical protein